MNKEIIYGICGIALGAISLFAIQNISGKDEKTMRMGEQKMHNSMMHDTSMGESMSMMTNSLKGKTGDEFDKAFLTEMIVHHEGAVAMAELALTSAGHQELKDLAQAIISAQNSEIEQMKRWQNEWFK